MRLYSDYVVKQLTKLKNRIGHYDVQSFAKNLGVKVRFISIEDNRLGFSTSDGYIFVNELL